MSGKLTESAIELAALDRPTGLGYEVLAGLVIAPGEPVAERADYTQVFLFDRLQTELEDLQEAIRGVLLPKRLSGELPLPSQLFRQAGVPVGARLTEAHA